MDGYTDKADFNMAVSYLNGLNQMFLAAASSQAQRNILSWYDFLLVIFTGIGCWMDDKEMKQMKDDLDAVHGNIIKSTTQTKGLGRTGIDHDTYWKMLDINMRFLKIAKEKNLLIKMKEDRSSGLSE